MNSPAEPSADALLNLPAAALPAACEVLVIGAGPAGSAAAITLARAGRDVVLVDQHAFPRDKICGDALIPDAHAALRRLGVFDVLQPRMRLSGHVGCIGPRGGRIDVPGALAVLPRRELDTALCRAAAAAGARMHAPLKFVAALEENGVVTGAVLQAGGERRELRARWVLLATGAVPQALMAAGMCERQTPSGVALRGYIRNPAMAASIDRLEVVWHRALRPGYGWIFPYHDGVFNIGVGLADSHDTRRNGRLAKREVNLKQVFDDFVRAYEPARRLVEGGEWASPLKGAPLRCTLEGSRRARPGLLVTGEAAGSTYSFTGEGIGKAMETGMLAAEALLAHADPVAACAAYEAGLAALKPRFDLYAKANRVNSHPWLADLLIWRAQRSDRLLARMSGVLNETSNPGTLVSMKGIVRLLAG